MEERECTEFPHLSLFYAVEDCFPGWWLCSKFVFRKYQKQYHLCILTDCAWSFEPVRQSGNLLCPATAKLTRQRRKHPYVFGKMWDNILLSYDVMCLFRWSAVRKMRKRKKLKITRECNTNTVRV